MVADIFLCESFAHRDIIVDGGIDIADEAQVAEAVRTNSGCVSCHQSLDPLAASFWGYKKLIHRNFVAEAHDLGCEVDWSGGAQPEFGVSYLPEDYCYPIQQYNTADEDDWDEWGLRPPGYYGEPVADLAEVGRQIAGDPRFAQCLGRNTFAWMAQIDRDDVPWEVAVSLQDGLTRSDFSPKQLLKQIVLSDEFAAAGRYDGAEHPLASMRVTRQSLRPALAATFFAALDTEVPPLRSACRCKIDPFASRVEAA